MRRRITAAALLAAATLVAALSVAARAQADPVSRAVAYLQGAEAADGSVPPGAFGGYTPTELYVIASAGDGFDASAMRGAGGTAISYLAGHACDAAATPGPAGLLAQAVVAAGQNPASFGGVNLATAITNGCGPKAGTPGVAYDSATGAYGDGTAYTQADAILGLRAIGAPVPTAAYAYLTAGQDGDGGWNYLAAKDNVTGGGSDTNSTAMALMALAGHMTTTVQSAAVAWLHTQQEGDGGFGNQLTWGTDPDSTALVIQALLAIGAPVDSAAWTTGGVTPYASLLAQQNGDGGFGYQSTTSDTYTTAQAALGLAREPLPGDHDSTPGTTPASTDAEVRTTIAYLRGNVLSNGGLLNPYSKAADVNETCDLVIAAAASGIDPATLTNGGASPIDYLRAETSDPSVAGVPGDPAKPASAGKLGKLLVAIAADRQDAATFGNNPLAALQGVAKATGAYGDGETASQSYAILGLVANHQAVPAKAVTYLRSLQDSDGGWNFTAAANDPSGSDTNSTAIALMALDAAAYHGADAAALAWLHTQQDSDGGFPYQATFGSDADSTALVVQALVAAHQNAASDAWAVKAATPVMWLAGQQDSDGGFGFQSTTSDPFTTSQVPDGLLRAPFPVTPAFAVGGLGPASSVTPTPVPTPAPSTPTPASAPAGPGSHSDAGTPQTVFSASNPTAATTPDAGPAVTPSPTPAPTGAVQGASTTSPAAVPSAPSASPVAPPSGSPWLIYLLAAIAAAVLIGGGGVLATRTRAS